MLPVLFEIPLPAWSVPLGALLGVAALVALFAVGLGFRSRSKSLFSAGVVATAGLSASAFLLAGQSVRLGSLPVYGYGTLLCLALVAGWFLTLRLANRDGLNREVIASTYVVAAVSGLVGARLLYVLENLAEFTSFGDVLAVRRGGLAVYGGFLVGAAVSLWHARRHRAPWLGWADVAAPSLAAGLVLGRLGCYLYGCDFGEPLGGWAPAWLERLGTFPRWEGRAMHGAGSPAWLDHVAYRGLRFDAPSSLPVHPTQLYEALAALALLVLLLFLRGRKRFRGEVFFAFAFGYGLIRFVIELVRGDRERGHLGPAVSGAEFVGVIALALALAFALGPARRSGRRPAWILSSLGGFALAGILFFAMRASREGPIELSTSQWIAVMSAFASSGAWAFWRRQELVPLARSSTRG